MKLIRPLFIALGAMLFSAFCNANLSWEYVSFPDKMSGKEIYVAKVESQELFKLGFPYNKYQRATLGVRQDTKKRRDVYLRIDEGQFQCSSYSCPLLVKFGDAKPVTFEGSGPSDGSSDMIFFESVERFISQMKKTNKVLIQVDFFRNGSRTFEFDVSNFASDRVFPGASSSPPHANVTKAKEVTTTVKPQAKVASPEPAPAPGAAPLSEPMKESNVKGWPAPPAILDGSK